MTPDKRVEEIEQDFINRFSSKEGHVEIERDAAWPTETILLWLRTTLTQDRASLHTSLVAAVEGKKKTLIHSEITLPADHEDVPEELLKRATPHIYNQALDDILTIINSIFKE